MRRALPKVGDTRVREGFLWLPMTIYAAGRGERRWLERARWVEVRESSRGAHDWWMPIKWLEIPPPVDHRRDHRWPSDGEKMPGDNCSLCRSTELKAACRYTGEPCKRHAPDSQKLGSSAEVPLIRHQPDPLAGDDP